MPRSKEIKVTILSKTIQTTKFPDIAGFIRAMKELDIPVKVSTNIEVKKGGIKGLCKHRHRSKQEAQKCLTRALPHYMKYQRR